MNKSNSLSIEEIREFVIAGHGDLEKVQEMLGKQPDLLEVVYEWGPGDTETALQAAAHMGNPEIARYLLAQGATPDICTAAMLGEEVEVERFLQEDADNIYAKGAHGIPLLTHAALSGSVEVVQLLVDRGASEGISSALINAVSKGHVDLAGWLLENRNPDVSVKNFQGKSVLEIAVERGNEEMAGLLKVYGASQQPPHFLSSTATPREP